VRPIPGRLSRLLDLHKAAGTLAETSTHILAHPEVARALEQALVHAMITCLIDGPSFVMGSGARRHSRIIARFEELLAANHDRPIYLQEICTATGVSARTLQTCCNDFLGMGPLRYLWLRRMHLARHAFLLADPTTTTVTEIATGLGFWELGRFSVAYRSLFGESPSASMRRPAQAQSPRQDSPFTLPSAQFA